MTERRPLHLASMIAALFAAAGLAPTGCTTQVGASASPDVCGGEPAGSPGYIRCADGAVDVEDPGACGGHGACQTDSDCPAQQLCVCGAAVSNVEPFGLCGDATCTTGADCESGECGASVTSVGCGTPVAKFACRNPRVDTCRADESCGQGEVCAFDGKRFSCTTPTFGCIGRPLLVDAEPRTAPAVRRGDWLGDGDFEALARALGDEDRAALAAHWTAVAAMEHASVASFARFSLELLALGAPPGLLADAQRAAADEIRHAEIAFGLASAYAGRPVGPGPLDLAGVHPATDTRAFLRGLIEEACVGETLGAALALASAEATCDPTLRAALLGVHEDEARHAALGWATLRWMLDREGASTRAFAIDELQRALRESRATVAPRRAVPSHGLLTAKEERDVCARTLEGVIGPLVDGLARELARAA